MKDRIRIKDIAAKAGVSAGTVDRVIHSRGNVSNKAKLKVMKAMEEMDYSPNLIASALAYNKTWNIGVLIPGHDQDPFWKQPKEGIEQALKVVSDYGFNVQYFHFRENDMADFLKKGMDMLNHNIHGVIISPIFSDQSNTLFDAFCEKNIPFVQINTCLDYDYSGNLCYIGQDSYYSGMLGAKLLAFGVMPHDSVMICHLEEKVYSAQHLLDKEKGFENFFDDHAELCINVVKGHYSDPYNDVGITAFFKDIIENHPNLKGIFISTSRAYRAIEAFNHLGCHQIKVVGYDLIDENISLLNEEKIDFLINQNPYKQGYLSIINLFNYWIRKIDPPKLQHLPLDVVMKENAPYYAEKSLVDIPLVL